MWASMTTRTPVFRSAFWAGLSFIRYLVVFSSMIMTTLLFLSLIVKLSLVTAVTVPIIGSPCAYRSPTNKTIATTQRTNRFSIVFLLFLNGCALSCLHSQPLIFLNGCALSGLHSQPLIFLDGCALSGLHSQPLIFLDGCALSGLHSQPLINDCVHDYLLRVNCRHPA